MRNSVNNFSLSTFVGFPLLAITLISLGSSAELSDVVLCNELTDGEGDGGAVTSSAGDISTGTVVDVCANADWVADDAESASFLFLLVAALGMLSTALLQTGHV